MPRIIQPDSYDMVFGLWMEGCSYRRISERTGVSTGKISQIIRFKRSRTLDLDNLRNFNLNIQNRNMSLTDLERTSNLLNKLNESGLSLSDIPSCIELCEKYNDEAGAVLAYAARLLNLEGRLGKRYYVIVEKLEAFATELESRGLDSKTALTLLSENLKRYDELETLVSDKENEWKMLKQETESLRADVESLILKKSEAKIAVDLYENQIKEYTSIMEKQGQIYVNKQKQLEDELGTKRDGLNQEIDRLGRDKSQMENEIKELDKSRKEAEAEANKIRAEVGNIYELKLFSLLLKAPEGEFVLKEVLELAYVFNIVLRKYLKKFKYMAHPHYLKTANHIDNLTNSLKWWVKDVA